MDVLMKGKVVVFSGDGFELLSQVLLSQFLVGVDVEDSGQATVFSKLGISSHSKFRTSIRGSIKISGFKGREQQGKAVTFALIQLTVHDDILGRTTLVPGVVSPPGSAVKLVDSLRKGILQMLSTVPDKITFINHHDSNLRTVIGLHSKVTLRSRSRDVKIAKTKGNNHCFGLSRAEANGTRPRLGIGLIIMEDIKSMGD